MESRYTTDPDVFLDGAGALLLDDPARNQLILGILGAVRKQPDLYDSYEAWFVEEGGHPVAAASMTTPYNLVLADAVSHWAVTPLAEAVGETGSSVPGVVGNRPTVDRFTESWRSHTGCEIEIKFEQGVFACDQVLEHDWPEGAPRHMMSTEREIVIDWWRAFIDEVHPEAPAADRLESLLDHYLDEGREQGMWVWDLHGRPVSMAAHSPFDFGTARIGPVYTPPEHRGSGYGTALVADLTESLLGLGLDRVCLYSDLANPTSNAIYERIGFAQVAESRQISFRQDD